MDSSTHFVINQPSVSYENFGEEVVALNFDTGTYYSFDKVAIDVWNSIVSGVSVAQIVKTISLRYCGNQEEIEKSVCGFLAKLLEEHLIVPSENKEKRNGLDSEKQVSSPPEVGNLDFEPPVLHIYTDMQELLLLDPVHEVDETGWPDSRTGGSDGEE